MELTTHARKRMAQRGVAPDAIKRVIEFGDQWIFVGKGCASVSISRDHAKKLIKSGELPAKVADRLANLCVVVANDEDAILTVVRPKSQKKARSYTRSKGFIRRHGKH